MGRLHRCGHAELGEAREVVGVEQLRVLDARTQPARLPALARRRRVRPARPGWRASPIACTASSSPASAQRPASSRSSLAAQQLLAEPGVGERLEHPGRARAERAVGERLDRADAQPLVAEAAAQPERDDLVDPLGRQRGPDAQRQAAVGVQPLPGGQAVLALEVVDARHAARVGLPQAARDGLVEHVLAQAAGSPRRRPRRRARARRRSARPRRRARRPERSPTGAARAPPRRARRCGGRAPRAAPGDRRRPRRGAAMRLGVAGGPARRRANLRRAASLRCSARPRRPPAPRRASAWPRGRAVPSESDHSRKWTCASVKPGTTQRPSEIDALVGHLRAIALADVDAAADAVARDGQRARERQRGSPV